MKLILAYFNRDWLIFLGVVGFMLIAAWLSILITPQNTTMPWPYTP